jgi:hypothetical protein
MKKSFVLYHFLKIVPEGLKEHLSHPLVLPESKLALSGKKNLKVSFLGLFAKNSTQLTVESQPQSLELLHLLSQQIIHHIPASTITSN